MKLQNAPEPIQSISEASVVNLDVRPILESGGEPFSLIMETIEKTPKGGAMRLRANFEPKPLFHVLGSQGWSHWVEYGAGDDWMIWFYQQGSAAESHDTCAKKSVASLASLKKDFPELEKRLTADGSIWRLDVRRLSPPEPMELTLAALEHLPSGATLLQVNERVPQLLLPLLKDRGFSYALENDGNEVQVKIERSS